MIDELKALHEALDRLAVVDVRALTSEERRDAVVSFQKATARLTGAAAPVFAAFDVKGDWASDVARSAASWIKHQTGDARADTGSRVWLSRHLSLMPIARAALVAGDITEGHVRALSRCLGPRTRDRFMDDGESYLVNEARRFDADQFALLVSRWLEVVDPEGAEPRNEKPNEFHLSRTLGGRYVGKFNLDAETGLPFAEAVQAKTDELFHRDKKLRENDPSDPLAGQCMSERRARAVVELVEQGASVSEPVRRRPAFTVVITGQVLQALVDSSVELDPVTDIHSTVFGNPVPRPLLDTWFCDCDVARLMMSADGVPLDLGRSVRTATREQRIALVARDGGCAVPGCDIPPDWTDAHHVRQWEDGGATDIDNLCSLCRHHHCRIHAGELVVEMVDRLPRFSLPDGRVLREQRRTAA